MARLIARTQLYGRAAAASQQTVDAMREMLASPLAARLLALPEAQLHGYLVNDAYKIRMHQMYARFFQGECWGLGAGAGSAAQGYTAGCPAGCTGLPRRREGSGRDTRLPLCQAPAFPAMRRPRPPAAISCHLRV